MKILYWKRNGFCLRLKHLQAERFKAKPVTDHEAIEPTISDLN